MLLAEYIKKNHVSNAEFGKANGVDRQQVNVWINKGFMVFDDTLYSARRKLKGGSKCKCD